jgi:ABC-type phosphate/phosphonate transport system substrate-binding protein
MPNELIANARMYSVAPGAVAAWKRLFAWLDDASGIRLAVIDHAFPAPLNDLWGRSDLAATFMCGWPWLRQGATHQIVAAPVPAAAYAEGRPLYRTHFVVHQDSPFQRLEDTFGHRFAYTIADSHSGYNAPRHHLMQYRDVDSRRLFSEIIGPLTTPRRMLEAIADKRTDVGPLDSFAFDLLTRHEPMLAAQTRVIASTALVPMPAIVASQQIDEKIVEKLRATLLALGSRPEHAALCDDLCISGFASLDPATYQIAEKWARAAKSRGLDVIA